MQLPHQGMMMTAPSELVALSVRVLLSLPLVSVGGQVPFSEEMDVMIPKGIFSTQNTACRVPWSLHGPSERGQIVVEEAPLA